MLNPIGFNRPEESKKYDYESYIGKMVLIIGPKIRMTGLAEIVEEDYIILRKQKAHGYPYSKRINLKEIDVIEPLIIVCDSI
mgnify:FL=1